MAALFLYPESIFKTASEGMAKRRDIVHIIASICLIMLSVTYQVNVIGDTHVHNINGVKVNHSHPFSSDSHSHSKASFQFADQLAKSVSLTASFIEIPENRPVFTHTVPDRRVIVLREVVHFANNL